MSSSKTWTCEADVLADLRILSSKKVALAGALASERLKKELQRQPTRINSRVQRAKEVEEITLEDVDMVDVDREQGDKETCTSIQEQVTMFGVGRAKRLEPYINNLKPAFDEKKLTSELRECGFMRDYSNRDIVANFQTTMLQAGQMSDKEEDTSSCSTKSSYISHSSSDGTDNKKKSVAERLFQTHGDS